MTSDRTRLEKHLQRHLGLFGSPSANQVEASRARVREHLRAAAANQAATDSEAPVHDIATSAGRTSRDWYGWRAGIVLAAAAAGIALAVSGPWQRDEWLAIVEAADGSRYTLAPNTVLNPSGASGVMLTLKDGSRVETRSRSELSLEQASDGIDIRLRTGGLVVAAAQQPRGHLYVHTKDMTVAVTGTMFVVNAEDSGSRVTVIEGEAQVREGAVEKSVKRGDYVSTNPAFATRPVRDEFSWSRHADAIYAAFTKGMGETAGPLVRIDPPAQPPLAGAQASAARPEFEAVSIRQCDPDHLPETPEGGRGGGANSFHLTPGRLRALCMTTATLIRTAYGYGPVDLDFIDAERAPGRAMNFGNVYGLGVEDGRRVRGGPDWVRSERYTVNAVTSPGVEPNADTLRRTMLQRLLERRFDLKAHIESEQIPAFALAVAKSGLKITPVGPGACDELPAREGSLFINGHPMNVLTPPRNFADVRRGQKPSCGMWSQRNGPNVVIVGGDVPLDVLTTALAGRLGGVRVLNKMNVKDNFNFILEFALDENTPGLPRAGNFPERGADLDVAPAATIFTALEEQIGLKLERAQAAREFIVIDQVQRPSEN